MKTSYPKSKINILLLENIHTSAVESFKHAGYNSIETIPGALSESELLRKIKDVHILGIRSKTKLTEKVFASAEKLLAAGCFCIGTNQVNMHAANANGTAVFNAPFSNTRSVAELAIAEMVFLIRRIAPKNNAAHQGKWLKESAGCFEVRGKTLGIIGYGHIGSQVSVLAEGLGMIVKYYDTEQKLPLGNARQVKRLETLLRESDIITLHVPETPATKEMINAARIRQMKKGVILLNLSRGEVIDTAAVKRALEQDHIAGLSVDVFPHEPESVNEKFHSPFQNMENVILTPHIGGSTMEAQESIGAEVSGKLLSFLETGSSFGSHSVPSLSLPIQHKATRLLHIHKNVPGVLSEIHGIISGYQANILGEYLQTNSQIGYVVLDIDRLSSEKVLNELKKVKHTIRLRSLF